MAINAKRQGVRCLVMLFRMFMIGGKAMKVPCTGQYRIVGIESDEGQPSASPENVEIREVEGQVCLWEKVPGLGKVRPEVGVSR